MKTGIVDGGVKLFCVSSSMWVWLKCLKVRCQRANAKLATRACLFHCNSAEVSLSLLTVIYCFCVRASDRVSVICFNSVSQTPTKGAQFYRLSATIWSHSLSHAKTLLYFCPKSFLIFSVRLLCTNVTSRIHQTLLTSQRIVNWSV